MFTLEEYKKLQAAAFVLHNKGLMKITPPSLMCYLMMLKSGKTSFKLLFLAEELNWPLERTRRSLKELASIQWEGLPLIEMIKNKQRAQGRFTPNYYQLMFRPTPEFPGTAQVEKPSSPKTIPPPRSKPPRLNSSCCLNKNNKQQTKVVGESLAQKLKKVGVSDKAIAEILRNYAKEIIQNQLLYLPYRQAKNPAGLLVQAIKGDWSAPKEYLSAKEEQKQAQEQQASLEEQKRKLACEAKQKEIRQKQLLAIEKQLSLPEKQTLKEQAEIKVRQRLGKGWPKEKPIPPTFLKSEFSSLLAQKYLKQKQRP